MKGDFLIDGTSAFNAYGVFVQRNGLAGLATMPSFKAIETVDWLDEDGIDANLSAPVLDKGVRNITFGFKDINILPEFYERLGNGENSSHVLNFSDIGRSYTLRMLSNGNVTSFIKAGSLTLTFVEDLVEVPETSPYSLGATRVTQRGFLLDGIDLSRFGCWVLDGYKPSWYRSPSVKENLIVSSRTVAGQTYYGQTDGVFYKSKDLSLKMLINARSVSEFNACYDALFWALTQPAARTLKLGSFSEGECYYKSSRCERLEVFDSGTVWCELTLTMTMLSIRPES